MILQFWHCCIEAAQTQNFEYSGCIRLKTLEHIKDGLAQQEVYDVGMGWLGKVKGKNAAIDLIRKVEGAISFHSPPRKLGKYLQLGTLGNSTDTSHSFSRFVFHV